MVTRTFDEEAPTSSRGRRMQEPSNLEALRSIALIGTYVPRRCGIATFTNDLATGLGLASNGLHVEVVAMNDDRAGHDYPGEVEFEIGQNELGDYRVAADHLNASRIDVVSVQHEFGIFGGADGAHILKLIAQLRMPVVTTLHTVLERPSPGQRRVVTELAALSDRLVVMSEKGRAFLSDIYKVDARRVCVVPHGIPDMPFVDPNYYKDQFDVEGKKVILTFGLVAPNKGIENVIRALPDVVARHPDVVYIVLGATHPHVKKASGEAYRLSLQQLARDLGVDDRVLFHDRYVDRETLCEFLGAADLYVTPYLNAEQIVSGTLAYAMGAGKAIVSTPYFYATEMLADGRGVVVPFADSPALARAVNELLADETARHAMRKRAYTFSRDATWAEVGRRYLDIFAGVRWERQHRPRRLVSLAARARATALPDIDLRHLRRLTDATGILQHAKYHVPDRAHGYCTDDNARALIVAINAGQHLTTPDELDELVVGYLGFLRHAYNPAFGTFRNFMGFDRRWLEERGSPDSHGRAVWALGVAAVELRDESLRAFAAELFHEAIPAFDEARDLRAQAFALVGLTAYLARFGGDTAVKRSRALLSERLCKAFEDPARDPKWPWPEPMLTYANASLPHALLEAGAQLENREMIARGLRALEWLVEVQTIEGRFSPIGNQGFFEKGGRRARFDQQPIDADATIAACSAAFRVTGERVWLDRAWVAFRWFLGQNDVGQSLYDHGTGGCRDGLHATRVNDNQGAESTLAWLHALLQMHALQAAGELGWTEGVATLPEPQKAAASGQ
jgi:glycosyltransferase involved in cell wall biosynthesis